MSNQVLELSEKEESTYQSMLIFLDELDSVRLNEVLNKTVGILNNRAELTGKSLDMVNRYKEDMNNVYLSKMKEITSEHEDKMASVIDDARKVQESDYNSLMQKHWGNIHQCAREIINHLVNKDGYTHDKIADWTFGVWKDKTGEKRVYLNDSNPFKDTENIAMGIYYVSGNIRNFPKQLVTKRHITVPVEIFEKIGSWFDELPLIRLGDIK